MSTQEKEMSFIHIEKYFPKDLQLSTWGFLSPIELCCVSRVCKSFNQTSSLDELWIHFVKPSKEITKDYKNYFLQKMKQSWEQFFITPKNFPLCFSRRIFSETYSPKAKYYQSKYPLLVPQMKTVEPNSLNVSPNYDFLFKYLLIGDSGVGKTSLMQRFFDDFFTDSYISTIGVDFKVKTINIENKIIKLQIWDTAGPERFRTITSSYYRGAHGILVIGDISHPPSMENMSHWKSEIDRYACESNITLYCFNKIDLEDDSQPSDQIEKYLPGNQKWIKTSAKTGENVDEMFETLTRLVLDRVQGVSSEIIWNENWASENLHTVIPNLESVFNRMQQHLLKSNKGPLSQQKSNSYCQMQ